MTYELAKKLKDAEFKQGNVNGQECDEFIKGCYVPTLSDLIEACGDRFGTLENKWMLGWECKEQFAFNTISDIAIIGKTPEEAVAKLWLEINKH